MGVGRFRGMAALHACKTAIVDIPKEPMNTIPLLDEPRECLAPTKQLKSKVRAKP